MGRAFRNRCFRTNENELKIKEYDIFGTLQRLSLSGFSMGGSLYLFGHPAYQAIGEVAILIGNNPYRANSWYLVCSSHICRF